MWSDVLLLSIFPLLAVVAVIDTAVPMSSQIGEVLRIRHRENALLVTLLCVAIIFFFAENFLPYKYAPGIIDYVIPEEWAGGLARKLMEYQKEEAVREFLSSVTFILMVVDIILVLISVPLVAYMANRQRRPIGACVLLSLLGNLGAAFWIFRNRREIDRSSASAPANNQIL